MMYIVTVLFDLKVFVYRAFVISRYSFTIIRFTINFAVAFYRCKSTKGVGHTICSLDLVSWFKSCFVEQCSCFAAERRPAEDHQICSGTKQSANGAACCLRSLWDGKDRDTCWDGANARFNTGQQNPNTYLHPYQRVRFDTFLQSD